MNFFEKFFQEYHQNVKQFGSKSGPSNRIGVETVCKGYQQTTLAGKELRRSGLKQLLMKKMMNKATVTVDVTPQ